MELRYNGNNNKNGRSSVALLLKRKLYCEEFSMKEIVKGRVHFIILI